MQTHLFNNVMILLKDCIEKVLKLIIINKFNGNWLYI